ncbi:MAG TPA: L-threonylcarbamoyladenylate synthase [Candidatus Gracilibacteria bacterium]|nr:L-threonylcarbamoyladenylate synthase [Candidatus Gracilibacteria bacterium]
MEQIDVGDGLSPDQVSIIVNALEEGKVVMHATETCYGLTVDPFQEEALARLYALKEMDLDKPVSLMVSSLEQGMQYGEFNEKARALAERFWPGPLTLIVPRKTSLPDFLNRGIDSVGLRCPDHTVTQTFLKVMGTPLVTTSANVSGKPQAYAPHETTLEPDLLVNSGRIRAELPSTIVKVEGDGVEIVREGDNISEVEMFLEQLVD